MVNIESIIGALDSLRSAIYKGSYDNGNLHPYEGTVHQIETIKETVYAFLIKNTTIEQRREFNRVVVNGIDAVAGGRQATIAGRHGVIEQLKEHVKLPAPQADQIIEVYYLHQSEPDGDGRVNLHVLKNVVFFTTDGDFEQNLVKYGIQ